MHFEIAYLLTNHLHGAVHQNITKSETKLVKYSSLSSPTLGVRSTAMRCVRSYSTIKAVLLINIQTIANGIWNFYVYIINLPFICMVCICAEVLQCLAVYFPCEVKGSQIDSQPLHALPRKLSSLYIGLEVQILQYNN